MKKLIFLFLILIALAPAQAQLEWAPVGARYYHSALDEWQGEYVHISEVTGDTLIAGKQCRVLNTWWHPGCEGWEFTYEEAGRVYFYDEESGSFGLLFDFTKGAGESWWMPVCSQWNGIPADSMQVFVDSVGFTDINGVPIRTQYVTWTHPWYPYTAHTKVYEGIGNAPVPYFFWGSYGLAVNVFLHTFNCYESPEHGIFNFVGGQPCGIYTTAEKAKPAAEKLWLHPNPANEYVIIRFPFRGAGRLILYDALGRVLAVQPFDDLPEVWTYDVSALPAGMYLLQCESTTRVSAAARLVKGH